jgi:transcriptional regulator with XRE-family HTH domain
VSSNTKLPEIRKEAFIEAREKFGLSAKDLGAKVCLSARQIEQIENGETSSFYGAQIKVTAAKKVAKLLNLRDEEAFDINSNASEKLSATPVQLPITEVKVVDAPIREEKKDPVKKVESAKVISKEIPFPATSVSPKSASSKKLFLWLSVLAALVFSAINLRPLFFADKPAEILVVKEEIIEPAPAVNSTEPSLLAPVSSITPVAPAVEVPAASTETSTACPAEEGIISYKTDVPRKAADLVYVQVKSKQVICVSDASGKMQNKLIEPGVGASFYGKPPFKVLTGGLAQVDVFFQGSKVRLTNLNYKTLVLEAAEVVAPPVERTDTQPR